MDAGRRTICRRSTIAVTSVGALSRTVLRLALPRARKAVSLPCPLPRQSVYARPTACRAVGHPRRLKGIRTRAAALKGRYPLSSESVWIVFSQFSRHVHRLV
jgi:hypothetical protein